MVTALFGIKKNMTSVYDNKGRRVGATIVSLPSNFVTQIKNVETDGYMAIQLGTGSKKSVKKPQQGHLKKASAKESTRFLKEVRVEDTSDMTLGQEVKVSDVLHAGDVVKVQGVSKGKGFQGGVRRWGFHGGPKTHGQSDRHRAPGSIGQGTTPGRVYKGKHMAGHMGVDTVSVKGLEVIKVDRANEEIVIKGGLPGPIGGLLQISWQGQVKGYVAPAEPEEEVIEEQAAPVDEIEAPAQEAQTEEQIPVTDEIEVPGAEQLAEQTEDTTTEEQPAETSEEPAAEESLAEVTEGEDK
jgi:large subunit ribosomal protein L3